MKKIFFILAISGTVFIQDSFAQLVPATGEDTTAQSSQLLQSYFNIKNALVAGNANVASANAEQFVKAINNVDSKKISVGIRKALLKDAAQISRSKNVEQQRDRFATLSTNMYALAKAVKLNTEPVYYSYCPMKKSYWLSNNKAIKNPYYGNAMLTCGEVKETIE